MEPLAEYLISSKTMMLAPAIDIRGGTIVYEVERVIHVSKTPLEIIRDNCCRGFATYDGRVKAVQRYLFYKHKVPIIIYERMKIAAFPTHSPKKHECHWVFPSHVRSFEKGASENPITYLVMRAGEKLEIPVSIHTVSKQYYRTNHLLHAFGTEW